MELLGVDIELWIALATVLFSGAVWGWRKYVQKSDDEEPEEEEAVEKAAEDVEEDLDTIVINLEEQLSSEWGTISDIAVINPEMTDLNWRGRQIAYIDIASIGCGVYNSDPQILLYDDAPSRARRVVKDGDILISTVRPNRRSMVQISKPFDNTVASTGFAVLRPKRIEDSDYLYSLVNNIQFTSELEMLAYGAAYPAVSTDDICRIPVYIPEAKERERRARLIGLISRFSQTNRLKIVDDYVSEIYRSWFIDFEPTKYKKRGNLPPGMNKEVAKLFPDTFEESELGMIPKGWKVCELQELYDVERGFSYTSEGLCEQGEGVPMFNLASFIDGGGYRAKGIKHYQGEHHERFVIKRGDVLFATLEQTHDLSLVGSPLIAPKEFQSKAIFSQDLLRVRAKSEIAPSRGFLYLWSKLQRMNIAVWASGTTITRIPPDALRRFPILVPSPEILQVFENIFEFTLEYMENQSNANAKLSSTIEFLLPKLVSKELEVQ